MTDALGRLSAALADRTLVYISGRGTTRYVTADLSRLLAKRP
jgi:hypothetical protein